jgi:hypothetical protein
MTHAARPETTGRKIGASSQAGEIDHQPPLDKRHRLAHPEIIVVGDINYERNDVTAKKYGESERSQDRRDKDGAPRAYFGGVKYRPQPFYDQYIARRAIRQHEPERPARRGSRR